jgi:hypothetical protein
MPLIEWRTPYNTDRHADTPHHCATAYSGLAVQHRYHIADHRRRLVIGLFHAGIEAMH